MNTFIYGSENSFFEFTKEIHQHVGAITCTSIFHSVVAKGFEIPASRGLLIVNNNLTGLFPFRGCNNMSN
jgi:hypothetical protein